jgi:hypothetical protein
MAGDKLSSILTVLIFMKVATANATPLDSYQGFVLFWLRFRHINNAEVSLGKKLCCFHDDVLNAKVVSGNLLLQNKQGSQARSQQGIAQSIHLTP